VKAVVLLCLLAVLNAQRVLKQETYKQIKESSAWDSYDFDENPFKEYTHEQIHQILGANLKFHSHNLYELVDNDDHSKSEKLPKEFDSRKQWPECTFEVRNQQHCGACWAFSATEVLQERFCIASKGKIKTVLSPQDMVSCDSVDQACHGGMLDSAWNYLEKTGVVEDKCFTYKSDDGKTVPHCQHGACDDTSVQFRKYRAVQGSSKPLNCSNAIKEEIMQNGSVQTGFMVYEDFMHYKGGVYEHVHGDQLGGHAIKISGWGVENGKEFWIAQNSWGPTWGEKGFFRIAFGQCEFEANAYAGLAKVDDFTPSKFFSFKKIIG